MDTRMLWRRGLGLVALIAVCPTPGAAQSQPLDTPVKLDDGESVRISGLVSGTLFMNRALFGQFGQGQNAEWADRTELPGNNTFTDGDIRNTRLRLDFTAGESVDGWSPRASIEVDFFGGQDAPPFGDEQPRLRLRIAYADLTNGRTTVRIGQMYAPLLGELPQSVSHVAFPIGYGSAGVIGWRFPGLFVYHDLVRGQRTTLGLQLAIMKGSGPVPQGAAAAVGTGEAAGLPQLEARVDLGSHGDGLAWGSYLVGHVGWEASNGLGTPDSTNRRSTGWALEGGWKLAPGRLVLHGNAYYGRLLGANFGHITQFGPVQGWGAWAQAGYNLTPRWSVWAFSGLDAPDADRFARESGKSLDRLKNQTVAGMVRYQVGRYAIGLEYLRATTDWSGTGRTRAQQFALSMLYRI